MQHIGAMLAIDWGIYKILILNFWNDYNERSEMFDNGKNEHSGEKEKTCR